MSLKLSLVFMKVLIFSTLFSLKANADTITIDLESHQLHYYDGTAGVELTYPIVGPRENRKYVYRNHTKFDIDIMRIRPKWRNRNTGKIHAAGSSSNPMGAGIIRFASRSEGYEGNCSIHGGARQSDFGQSLSGCCIRLIDKHFLELFYNVTSNTNIIFKESPRVR